MSKKPRRKLQPFLEMPEHWEEAWEGMPEYSSEDQSQYKSLIVNFADKQDMEAFAKLINQKITFKTQSIWYPKAEITTIMGKNYINDES